MAEGFTFLRTNRGQGNCFPQTFNFCKYLHLLSRASVCELWLSLLTVCCRLIHCFCAQFCTRQNKNKNVGEHIIVIKLIQLPLYLSHSSQTIFIARIELLIVFGGVFQSQYVHMIYRYKLAKTGCFYNILPLSLLYFKMFRILNKAIEKNTFRTYNVSQKLVNFTTGLFECSFYTWIFDQISNFRYWDISITFEVNTCIAGQFKIDWSRMEYVIMGWTTSAEVSVSSSCEFSFGFPLGYASSSLSSADDVLLCAVGTNCNKT